MEVDGGKSAVPPKRDAHIEEQTPPVKQKTHAPPPGAFDPITPAQINSRRVQPQVMKDYVLPAQKLSQGRLISTTVGEPPKPMVEGVSKFYIHDTKPGCFDITTRSPGECDKPDIKKEFSCFQDELLKVSNINDGNEDDIIVKIKDIRLTKELHTLTSYYGYDCFDKCLDAKIIDAHINDMREKIHYDECVFGKVYLENTEMAARFQFTQIDEAELCEGEALERSTVAVKYVAHDMVFLPMRVRSHWFLVVLIPYLRVVQVLTSDEKFNAEIVQQIRIMVPGLYYHLEQLKSYFRWKAIDVNTWDIDMLAGLPQQEGRTSSGLFMLKFMEHYNGYRLEKAFSQNLVDEFRSKLAAILVNSDNNEEQKMKRSPEI